MNTKKWEISSVNSSRALKGRLPESVDFLKYSSWMLFCNFQYYEFLFILIWYKLSVSFFPNRTEMYVMPFSLYIY